jgi:hypothetical protein
MNLSDTIDKSIEDSKERSLMLRHDIDDILDAINNLNTCKKAEGISEESLKEAEKSIVTFRVFFDNFSKMLEDSEKITKTYEDIKKSMTNEQEW